MTPHHDLAKCGGNPHHMGQNIFIQRYIYKLVIFSITIHLFFYLCCDSLDNLTIMYTYVQGTEAFITTMLSPADKIEIAIVLFNHVAERSRMLNFSLLNNASINDIVDHLPTGASGGTSIGSGRKLCYIFWGEGGGDSITIWGGVGVSSAHNFSIVFCEVKYFYIFFI